MAKASLGQKRHYEAIHDDYRRHYYDSASMAFRRRFVYRHLFEGIDLNGKDVLDLASGSGFNTLEAMRRFPGLRAKGCDISGAACADYVANTGFPCRQLDLTAGKAADLRGDVAMIFGGLHHCVGDLPNTFRAIAAMVRPGGTLLMFEPNRNYILEGARRLWYKWDRYFDDDTEEALDHDRIARLAEPHFQPEWVGYMGGPAYFLIYNSLLFRLPLKIKQVTAPTLFAIESLYNRLPGRAAHAYFLARWRRR